MVLPAGAANVAEQALIDNATLENQETQPTVHQSQNPDQIQTSASTQEPAPKEKVNLTDRILTLSTEIRALYTQYLAQQTQNLAFVSENAVLRASHGVSGENLRKLESRLLDAQKASADVKEELRQAINARDRERERAETMEAERDELRAQFKETRQSILK